MNRFRACVPALLAVLAATPAASQVRPFPPGLEPLPVTIPNSLPPEDLGPNLEPQCLAVYLDETTSTGFYIPPGAGIELLDDLHTTLTSVQTLCGFDFGYYKPTSGTCNATFRFFAGSPGDGAPGALMAGPFLLTGLPSGAHAFHVDVPSGQAGPDMWMGVTFSDDDAGLLTFDPPTLGNSHDVAIQNPPGLPGNFGGNPPANFYLGIHASPSTNVRASSWGSLKSLYRD